MRSTGAAIRQHRKHVIRDNETAIGQVLDALRDAGADTATTSVEMLDASTSPSAMAPFRIFDVQFPFSSDDWNRFQTLVAHLAATPWVASVGPGSTISGLRVRVHGPATAYQQLTSVIAAVGAGRDHPLQLAWALDNPPAASGGSLSFTGSVTVGAL